MIMQIIPPPLPSLPKCLVLLEAVDIALFHSEEWYVSSMCPCVGQLLFGIYRFSESLMNTPQIMLTHFMLRVDE